LLVAFVLPLSLFACRSGPGPGAGQRWSLAIHGGAGVLSKNTPPDQVKEYEDALRRALQHGRDRLDHGDSALDVCESVVQMLEEDPHFNAGKGAVFNEKGEHELDASIMDGSTRQCGAVAGVRTVKSPIGLARLVMTKTKHVLLMGEGAEQFATTQGVERVPNTYFDTEHRRKSLDEVLQERARTGMADGPLQREHSYGTVGCVALDQGGRLAAATSTGGMTGKRWGRVGDTPIIGAGNYADSRVAVSCTGTGEQFIRHVIAHSIAARVRFGDEPLTLAAMAEVHGVLRPGDGGLIAVDSDGHIAMPFNSEGMYRGAADASGRFEVAIFE
jgi:beta-aspartyl-peptidase (threonine type)